MPAYDEDVFAWAFEQARFLREGRFDLLDIEHLADEIDDVWKTELRELIKQISALFVSLAVTHRRKSRKAVTERVHANSWRLFRPWMLPICAPGDGAVPASAIAA